MGGADPVQCELGGCTRARSHHVTHTHHVDRVVAKDIAAVEEMLCPGSLYSWSVPAIVTGNRVVAQPGLVIPEFVYARPATGFEQHRSLFCHNIITHYYISCHRMIHRTRTPQFFRLTMN